MKPISRKMLNSLREFIADFDAANNHEQKVWGQSIDTIAVNIPTATRKALVSRGLIEVTERSRPAEVMKRYKFGTRFEVSATVNRTYVGKPTGKGRNVAQHPHTAAGVTP